MDDDAIANIFVLLGYLGILLLVAHGALWLGLKLQRYVDNISNYSDGKD